jgi:hypothetical protein
MIGCYAIGTALQGRQGLRKAKTRRQLVYQHDEWESCVQGWRQIRTGLYQQRFLCSNLKGKASDALRVFCQEFGVPDKLTFHGLKEQTKKGTEFMKQVRKNDIDYHVTRCFHHASILRRMRFMPRRNVGIFVVTAFHGVGPSFIK